MKGFLTGNEQRKEKSEKRVVLKLKGGWKEEKKVANKKNKKKERLKNSVKKYGPKFLKVARVIGLFILVVYLIFTEPEEQGDSLLDVIRQLNIADTPSSFTGKTT